VKVSAVITTKDRPQFLLAAVRSVRRQSRPVDELFIVNDGSPEGVPAELRSADVTVIQNERSRGGAYARNLGAARASGEILMFLDDDDEWTAEKVAAQLVQFDAEPSCVLVYSGRRIRSDRAPERVIRQVSSKRQGNLYPGIFGANLVGVTSSVAVRRQVFQAVGGFDESLPCRQDYDLWLRVCQQGSVRWDGGYHVLYTVFDDPSRQVSGRPERHVEAAKYLLHKYAANIAELPAGLRGAAVAEKWFSVAKAYRRSSWLQTALYSGRAFRHSPRVNQLALLLPRFILSRFGG
jgi:glycosyltransferase involved in cell wall biosynthesis